MPTRALQMRKIRELIRLKYEARLSHEQIARSLCISKGVVAKYVTRIEARALDPQQLLAAPEGDVLRQLSPAPRPRYGRRIVPDYGHVHAELKRPGVTLTLLWQEYVAAHADGPTYRFSQFADRYRDYVASLRRSMRQVHRAGEKLFVDYAGGAYSSAVRSIAHQAPSSSIQTPTCQGRQQTGQSSTYSWRGPPPMSICSSTGSPQ